MTRYELVEGASSKFWQVELSGSTLTTQWGRIGTAGQSKTKSFASAALARKEHDSLVAEKLKKGYREVGGLAVPPALPVIRQDVGVYNEATGFLITSARLRGKELDSGTPDWDKAVSRGDLLPFELVQDDPFVIRVVVGGSLAPTEEEQWVGRLSWRLRVPDGKLVVCGGVEYVMEAWDPDENEEDHGADYRHVMAVPAGTYHATLYGFLQGVNGEHLLERAGGPAQGWPRGEPEDGPETIGFLLHLQPDGAAPLPAEPPETEDGWFSWNAFETRRPAQYPAGVPAKDVVRTSGAEGQRAPEPPAAVVRVAPLVADRALAPIERYEIGEAPAEASPPKPLPLERPAPGAASAPLGKGSATLKDVLDALGQLATKMAAPQSLTGAASDGDVEAVLAFLDAGAGLEEKSVGFSSPLQAAANTGQTEVVEVLLARGADPHARKDAIGSPMAGALRWGHELFDKLLAAAKDLSEERHALTTAALVGELGPLRALLDRGAGKYARYALKMAAEGGQYSAVKMLLEACPDWKEYPALRIPQAAQQAGHTEIHRLLMGQPHDDAKALAVEAEKKALVVKSRDQMRENVAKRSAPPAERKRLLGMVREAVAAGVLGPGVIDRPQVNAGDWGMITPLMAAARAGDLALVEALLAAGAKATVKVKRAQTARHFAQGPHCERMLELFAQHGEKRPKLD